MSNNFLQDLIKTRIDELLSIQKICEEHYNQKLPGSASKYNFIKGLINVNRLVLKAIKRRQQY